MAIFTIWQKVWDIFQRLNTLLFCYHIFFNILYFLSSIIYFEKAYLSFDSFELR